MTATGSRGLLCVWPIFHDEWPREDLIDEALDTLPELAAEQGARIPPRMSILWEIIEAAADVPGWEWYPGPLLTCVVNPVVQIGPAIRGPDATQTQEVAA